MGGGIRGCRPTGSFAGNAPAVLQLEGNVTLLNLQFGGDHISEPLFDVEQPLAPLCVITQGRDPKDPLLTIAASPRPGKSSRSDPGIPL